MDGPGPGVEVSPEGGESTHDETEKLHRIRDLLFGETARAQTQRADSLEISFSAALADAEQRFQERLDSAVAAADAALSSAKEGLENEVQGLKADLASTQEELRTAQAALASQSRAKVERSDFAEIGRAHV